MHADHATQSASEAATELTADAPQTQGGPPGGTPTTLDISACLCPVEGTMSHALPDVKPDATPGVNLTPNRTEWGKMSKKKDGKQQIFNITTQDVDRALALAGLTATEAALFEQIREECWTRPILEKKPGGIWPEAKGCTINLQKLANATGIVRQQWSKAKRNLIASHLIEERDDGTLRINKQADEWINPTTGKPRLTDKLIEFCRSAQPGYAPQPDGSIRGRNETVNPRSPHMATVTLHQADCNAPQLVRCGPDRSDCNAPQSDRCGHRNQIVADTATGPLRSGPRPYRNRREEENLEIKKEAAATLPAAADIASLGGGKPAGAT